MSSEKLSASREQVEEDMFELWISNYRCINSALILLLVIMFVVCEITLQWVCHYCCITLASGEVNKGGTTWNTVAGNFGKVINFHEMGKDHQIKIHQFTFS